MNIFAKLVETVRLVRALSPQVEEVRSQQARVLEELQECKTARLDARIEQLAREHGQLAREHGRILAELQECKTARLDARIERLAQVQHTILGELQQLPIERRFDEVTIAQGRILSALQRESDSTNLQDYEFQVFSQWGEDGILQHLTRHIDIANKTFIEFGVEDFSESNCRFLMMKDHWRGFVMDGSAENIERLKRSHYYWRYNLTALEAFITRSNINSLLQESGFDADLGILSIDLDGVDYWILESIQNLNPGILVLEYNSVFGKERPISVPYEDGFVRTEHHHSNLYFGASLPALVHLAARKGYSLVGTNRAGVNAFFVRNDLINERVPAVSLDAAFTPSAHRESRDDEGMLTFLSGDARLEAIRGLPVVNVVTGDNETL